MTAHGDQHDTGDRCSPACLCQTARDIADRIAELAPPDWAAEVDKLKQDNPVMHALVKYYMPGEGLGL